VVASSSLEVQRRSRRAQTARLEVYTRLTLRQRQAAGERQGWSVVRVPSVDAEDRRQLHRELRTAQRDRTRVIHRMQGLLAGLAEWQGSRSPAWTDPNPACAGDHGLRVREREGGLSASPSPRDRDGLGLAALAAGECPRAMVSGPLRPGQPPPAVDRPRSTRTAVVGRKHVGWKKGTCFPILCLCCSRFRPRIR
jgi:hypothetical protein